MKKELLSLFSLGLAVSVFGQQSVSPELRAKLHQAVPHNKTILTGSEQVGNNASTSSNMRSASSVNGTVIGGTTYDLQTNGAIQNRLVRHSDGTISAAWTFSNTFTLASPDRGTGYNYFNGSSWGTAPTARIENERGGWPSLLGVAGGELITHHNTTSNVITQSKRNAKGTGTWAQTNITNVQLGMLWNRTAVGGPNGQTVHMIAVTAPTGNGGSVFNGQNGALLYHRSLDGGVTWDAPVHLPQINSTQFVGFSGDGYAITAKGNTVAFAIFNTMADVVLMKSTDNGLTWTKKIIMDFPLDLYDTDDPTNITDINNDGVADTLTTCDGAGSLIIDNNNNVHVTFGKYVVLDASTVDPGYSYFPFLSDSLYYWNENMPENSWAAIASPEDPNNDGLFINPNENATSTARYFVSLAGMPSMAYDDATGAIFVSYQGYREDLDDGVQSYRHIYVVRSSDHGCTWNTPTDKTDNGPGFEECVFASMAPSVGDSVRFIYQEDDQPGLAVRGDEDPYGNNEIVYVSFGKNTLNNTAAQCNAYITKSNSTFCAGDTVVLTASCGSAYQWSTGGTSQAVNVTQYGIYTVTVTTACGPEIRSIELTAPNTGPSISISSTLPSFCPNSGDTATLTASAASLATYAWSTGGTSQSINVTDTGTYTVTVTNCGGTTIESFTLGIPTTAPAPIINGSQFICSNGSEVLSISGISGASYSWSTGATSSSITVTSAGTYTVTVSNCAGNGTASITVSVPPVPTGNVNNNGSLTGCEGSSNVLLSAVDGTSWLWSNGATTQSITLTSTTESGSYTVTVSNICGDSAISSSVTVTIYPAAAVPTVVDNGNGTYSSSISGSSYQWFLNGNAISGATSNTFNPGLSSGQQASISVRVTDDNGCDATSVPQTVVSVNAINKTMPEVRVFPNPNAGVFSVKFVNAETGVYTMRLTSLTGQLISNRVINITGSQQEQFDISNLGAGIYFLSIENNEKQALHKVIVR